MAYYTQNILSNLPIGSFNGDGDITRTRENQMEKKLDNDMENWDCIVVGSPLEGNDHTCKGLGIQGFRLMSFRSLGA